MFSASDIRDVEFTKNMGGYKVAEVEAFVEACAQTVDAMAAEKEELTKKLSILADKLVEYRRDEDSIRSALLSAQRTGDAIIREANEKSAQMLEEANREAEKIVRDAEGSITHYESEINRLKNEINDFKTGLLNMYKEHITLLKSIPSAKPQESVEQPKEEPVQQPVKETVVQPVNTVAVAQEPVVEEVKEEPKEEPVKAAPEQTVTFEAPTRSKFANLKFGEDYNLSDDQDDE